MNKEYQAWVDIIKGIAIIAVVLLHINYPLLNSKTLPLTSILGNSWHMPVFFIVAGFFVSFEKMSQPIPFISHKFTNLYSRLLYFYIPILIAHNLFIHIGLYDCNIIYGGKDMELLSLSDYVQKLFGVMFFMGREPYASPLWFVYVLFLAFILMSIITRQVFIFTANKGKVTEKKALYIAGVIFALLSSISLYLTTVHGVMIPRISNTFSAMWLIFLGFIIKNKLKISFDNKYALIFSFIVFFGILLNNEEMCLMTNHYHDTVEMTSIGVSSLYILAYTAKKIEKRFIGTLLAKIGNKSFYIMSLHLISINITAMILNKIVGINIPYNILGSFTNNFLIFFLLLLSGVFLPLAFAGIFDKSKRIIKK